MVSHSNCDTDSFYLKVFYCSVDSDTYLLADVIFTYSNLDIQLKSIINNLQKKSYNTGMYYFRTKLKILRNIVDLQSKEAYLCFSWCQTSFLFFSEVVWGIFSAKQGQTENERNYGIIVNSQLIFLILMKMLEKCSVLLGCFQFKIVQRKSFWEVSLTCLLFSTQ